MFLDSLLGLPSQIISTTGGLLNNLISIPAQLVGSVTGSINTVANTAGKELVQLQILQVKRFRELLQRQQTFCQVPWSSSALALSS